MALESQNIRSVLLASDSTRAQVHCPLHQLRVESGRTAGHPEGLEWMPENCIFPWESIGLSGEGDQGAGLPVRTESNHDMVSRCDCWKVYRILHPPSFPPVWPQTNSSSTRTLIGPRSWTISTQSWTFNRTDWSWRTSGRKSSRNARSCTFPFPSTGCPNHDPIVIPPYCISSGHIGGSTTRIPNSWRRCC